MTMSLTAKHILVKGKVQGVFFRKYTRQMATDLKISGWVKNTDEGHVKIFAQGNEDAINRLAEWCWKGSPNAHVTSVEIKNANPDMQLKHFSVEH